MKKKRLRIGAYWFLVSKFFIYLWIRVCSEKKNQNYTDQINWFGVRVIKGNWFGLRTYYVRTFFPMMFFLCKTQIVFHLHVWIYAEAYTYFCGLVAFIDSCYYTFFSPKWLLKNIGRCFWKTKKYLFFPNTSVKLKSGIPVFLLKIKSGNPVFS